MSKIYSFIITVIFMAGIGIVVLAVVTISLTKKINEDRQKYQQGIYGVVEKQSIPVLGLSSGVISRVNISAGQEVQKGQLLFEISNPVLADQYKTLQKYTKDNVSAQTQAAMAKSQLDNNKIISPVNGVVDTVSVTMNSPVDPYTKVISIFENENTKVLAYLTTDQYVAAQKLTRIPAFNTRLNQDFFITPDILRPNQENPEGSTDHKIALYFKLVNKKDALSLLNGEQLQLRLSPPQQELIKPIDYIVNFWNKILH